MSGQGNAEVEIMRVHESGRTFNFWMKMLFTLGFYTIAWRSRSWILTDRRLIRHTGIINIQEQSIPLRNIQDVEYRASLLGRMLNYGNLRVESAGEDNVAEMINVGQASQFRAKIFDSMQQSTSYAAPRR